MLFSLECLLLWLNLGVASLLSLGGGWLASRAFGSLPKQHATLIVGLGVSLTAPFLVGMAWVFGWGQLPVSIGLQDAPSQASAWVHSERLRVRQDEAAAALAVATDLSVERPIQDSSVTQLATGIPSSEPGLRTGTQSVSAPSFAVDSLSGSTNASYASETYLGRTIWFFVGSGLVWLWLLGALVVSVLQIRDVYRSYWLVRRCKPLRTGWPNERLSAATRTVGIEQDVQLHGVQGLLAPVVVGFYRPKILVPADSDQLYTPQQFDAVLIHELSHIARRDHRTLVLLAIAQILYWWNPLVSLVVRRISDIREMICDDMVTRECLAPNEYASTIVRLAERAIGGAPGWLPLGISESSTSELERRVERILSSQQDYHELHVSRSFRAASSIFACLLITGVVVAQIPQVTSPQVTAERPVAVAAADQGVKRFTLTVVGPDGEPIANARVELWGRQFEEQWLVDGSFVRRERYGTVLTTNDQGQLGLELPEELKPELKIQAPGFGQYWVDWGHDPMPAEFTAQLDAGRAVGGVVVDEQGNPISGAVVRASVPYKKRPSDSQSLYDGQRMTTDDAGRWRYDYLPTHMEHVSVEITHSAYAATRQQLSAEMFALVGDQTPSNPVVMRKGLTVRGRVTDSRGNPIELALVRSKFLNDIRETRSDAEGYYELNGCQAGVAKIVVSAPKLATDMQTVQLTESLDQVDFAMQPGGHVRIRVIDEDNQPIPKARIFFQSWRADDFGYFEFDHVSQYADQDGVWEWNEAPLDEFKADICRPGGMSLPKQSLIARSEEYVFSPPPALEIIGKVIDAVTKQSIERFEVVPGVRSSPQHMNWVPSFVGTGGEFNYKETHGTFAHLLKVQARGYSPKVSRDIQSDEGRVKLIFALEPGENIDMRVMTPTGLPAVGAEVVLGLPGAQISVTNGRIDKESTYAQQTVVNEAGRFRFAPQSGPYHLVILHDTGFAHLDSQELERKDLVRLTPWAKIEGVYRVAGQAVPGVQLYLNSGDVHSYGPDAPSVFTSSYLMTGANGQFALDRVFPGNGSIQRNILRVVGEGSQEVVSAKRKFVEFQAGETATVDFEGRGTSIQAQLLPPEGNTEKVLWSFADVSLEPDLGPGPMPVPAELEGQPAKLADWYEQWRKTEAGKTWLVEEAAAQQEKRRADQYTATVAPDGTFTITDVSPGNYVLNVSFWGAQKVGSLRGYKITVPNPASANPATLNMGQLRLQQN